MHQFNARTTLQNAPPVRVIVVEDDPLLRVEVSHHLSTVGFSVQSVNSGSALNDLLATDTVNLFVIDINLPGESGIQIAHRLRNSQPDAGIVIMTARTSITDKIAGYQQGGADFYLTKPIEPTELLLVLQGLSKRIDNRKQHNAWQLSLRERSIQAPNSGLKVRLTAKEKTLILALTQASQNTLSSGELCDLFMDTDGASMSKHALEELITRLRRKLRSSGDVSAETIIQSVWGHGYQFCATIVLTD
jgi:DNA-binding response OmpR family regulator